VADTAWPYCLTLPGMPNWVFQPPTICLYGIYLPDRHCYGTVDIYAPAYRIAASEVAGMRDLNTGTSFAAPQIVG